MANNFAEIMIKLGLDNKDFDKGVKQTKSSLGDLGKDMLKVGAVVGGVAVAVGAAGKALYEVGKRGAIVTQTADSFDFLSKKLGLAPDLLEQLRKASRGTVDDMTLMSSTATLLAGTSDELGKALGNATPELLEIAKAANKLNPSLGTTSHMYESIALGIKRASPMILDNLGLTIKIGDANEAMAKQLGKSVEALTAEEKQMALLNATLEAGGNLIDQVGGNVDSATDDFARMETNIQNLKDTFMKGLAPAIAEATSRLTEFMTKQFEGAELQKYTTQLLEEKIITDEQALVATMNLAKGIWDLDDAMDYLSQYVPDVTSKELLLEEQMWKTGDAAEQQETRFRAMADGVTLSMDDVITATDNWSLAMAGAKGALEGLSGTLDGLYANALKTATSSVYELERAKLVLRLGTEDLSAAEIEHALDMLDSIDRMEKLNQAVSDGEVNQRDYRLALMDGIITIDEFNDLMGITGDEAGTAASKVGELDRHIRNLQGKTITITTKFKTEGQGSFTPFGEKGTGKTPKAFGQHGLDMVVPPGFPGDKFPVFASSGERVIIQRKDQQSSSIGTNMMAGISGGIGSGYQDTARDTMSAMGGLVKSAEKALGISSPSEMFYDIGVSMMQGLEMGILHRMPYVNDALLKAGNGLYNTFQNTMLNRNPDLLKVWNMMWNTIKNSSDETLSDLGADYSDFFEIMRDQFRDGYAFISGEWIEIMDYMVTNTDITKDEMIAILESLGVEANEGWAHYMEEFGLITDDGLSGVIGDAERFSKDYVDIIKITWNDVLYITDKSSAAYIDLWDKTAEGTRKAALAILGDLNDVIGFEWPTTDFFGVPGPPIIPQPAPPKPNTADWGAPLPTKPTTADWGAPLPPKYQHGGSFIVPSGFPGDTFPIRVSSGERVTVQRKDQQSAGVNQVNNLNIYTNAPVTSDVPDLLLLRAWSNG